MGLISAIGGKIIGMGAGMMSAFDKAKYRSDYYYMESDIDAQNKALQKQIEQLKMMPKSQFPMTSGVQKLDPAYIEYVKPWYQDWVRIAMYVLFPITSIIFFFLLSKSKSKKLL